MGYDMTSDVIRTIDGFKKTFYILASNLKNLSENLLATLKEIVKSLRDFTHIQTQTIIFKCVSPNRIAQQQKLILAVMYPTWLLLFDYTEESDKIPESIIPYMWEIVKNLRVIVEKEIFCNIYKYTTIATLEDWELRFLTWIYSLPRCSIRSASVKKILVSLRTSYWYCKNHYWVRLKHLPRLNFKLPHAPCIASVLGSKRERRIFKRYLDGKLTFGSFIARNELRQCVYCTKPFKFGSNICVINSCTHLVCDDCMHEKSWREWWVKKVKKGLKIWETHAAGLVSCMHWYICLYPHNSMIQGSQKEH